MESIYESGNNPYTLLNNAPIQNTPYLFTSIHDNKQLPSFIKNSDLKQSYLKKEQINSRMISPTISISSTPFYKL